MTKSRKKKKTKKGCRIGFSLVVVVKKNKENGFPALEKLKFRNFFFFFLFPAVVFPHLSLKNEQNGKKWSLTRKILLQFFKRRRIRKKHEPLSSGNFHSDFCCCCFLSQTFNDVAFQIFSCDRSQMCPNRILASIYKNTTTKKKKNKKFTTIVCDLLLFLFVCWLAPLRVRIEFCRQLFLAAAVLFQRIFS